MGRPLSITQTLDGHSYSTSYTYDLLGHVTTLRYPSNRAVNYSYDAAGRELSVDGNLGDDAQRGYSTGIIY